MSFIVLLALGASAMNAWAEGGTISSHERVAPGQNQLAAIPAAVPETGACLPLDQPIRFVAKKGKSDTISFRAGAIPNGETVGQAEIIQMKPGTALETNGKIVAQRKTTDGAFTVTITPQCEKAKASLNGIEACESEIEGTFSISEEAKMDIRYQFGTQPHLYPEPEINVGLPLPFPLPRQAEPCISGIAIEGNIYGGTLYNTNIYLYLNNSSHGYRLYASTNQRKDLPPIQLSELPMEKVSASSGGKAL